jgi:transcriptional regulator with XRE-family HTH domain
MGNRRFVGEDTKPQTNYFKAWRVHRGYRQSDVEKILGWRVGRVSNLECGRAVYTRHVLQSLARVYGCTTAQLLGEPPADKSVNKGSFDKQTAIAAANLTQVIELIGRLQKVATVLRDRVMPQVETILLDLKNAGDAADTAIEDAEQLAEICTRYLAHGRVPTAPVSDIPEYADADSEIGNE